MRYYRAIISDPDNGQVYTPPGFSAANLGNASYTSFVNGVTLPGAWNVELDIPVINAATSDGNAGFRVWGVSRDEIAQANNLNPIFSSGTTKWKNISIYGGMQKGLPLANPAQAGLLVSGVVLQCFGNWQGPVMTLDFVIAPGTSLGSTTGGIGSLARARNFTLNWQGGQALGPALQSCLQTAFPGYTINMNISSAIVRPQGDTPSGMYSSLGQLAQDARTMSMSIIKTQGYAGISIVPSGKTINVFDGSIAGSDKPVAIAFQDLIGQPTWLEGQSISFKTVMRGDLSVGKKITLPQTVITNTQNSTSSLVNQKATFQGGFTVANMRHVGDYRAPTADAWVTVFEGAPNNPVGAST